MEKYWNFYTSTSKPQDITWSMTWNLPIKFLLTPVILEEIVESSKKRLVVFPLFVRSYPGFGRSMINPNCSRKPLRISFILFSRISLSFRPRICHFLFQAGTTNANNIQKILSKHKAMKFQTSNYLQISAFLRFCLFHWNYFKFPGTGNSEDLMKHVV